MLYLPSANRRCRHRHNHNPAAETIAVEQGISDPKTYYLFRDHFLIVGPTENPANISESASVSSTMAAIFQSAEKNTVRTTIPTRWLSRYDKSATNIKESQLWLGIGQVSYEVTRR
jgi:ABC-type tungstate transport system permease subunit